MILYKKKQKKLSQWPDLEEKHEKRKITHDLDGPKSASNHRLQEQPPDVVMKYSHSRIDNNKSHSPSESSSNMLTKQGSGIYISNEN